jgi:hypothetical protein
MQPTINEKKIFVLRIHASYAFSTVADICEQILNKPIPAKDPLYHPLMVAIYTTYGRPFTKSWGFGKLPNDFIPDEFKVLHSELITQRDKLYAHVDKDMDHIDYGPANELRVTVGSDSRCQLWTQPFQPSHQQVKDIFRLVSQLHQKMKYWTDEFVEKYMHEMEVSPGDYLVNTESETELLQKRDTGQANRERIHVNHVASLYGTPKAPHP